MLALALKIPKIYAPKMTKKCIFGHYTVVSAFQAPLPRNPHKHLREPIPSESRVYGLHCWHW